MITSNVCKQVSFIVPQKRLENMSDIVCMYISTSLYHKETVFEKESEYTVVEFK